MKIFLVFIALCIAGTCYAADKSACGSDGSSGKVEKEDVVENMQNDADEAAGYSYKWMDKGYSAHWSDEGPGWGTENQNR